MATRPNKPKTPRTLEGVYVREMRKIWLAAQRLIWREIQPIVSNWPEPKSDDIGLGQISRRISSIERKLNRFLESTEIYRTLRTMATRVNRWTRNEIQRVLGVEVSATDRQIDRALRSWVDGNVDLIKTGIAGRDRRSLLGGISDTIERAHRNNVPVDRLKDQIQERFNVSNSRAQLIARDQILKLNGKITEHRQKSEGIERYRWSTSHDERVRPMHQDLDGTIQRWSDPPEVAPGRHEHPGGDYQCRCSAIPIREE